MRHRPKSHNLGVDNLFSKSVWCLRDVGSLPRILFYSSSYKFAWILLSSVSASQSVRPSVHPFLLASLSSRWLKPSFPIVLKLGWNTLLDKISDNTDHGYRNSRNMRIMAKQSDYHIFSIPEVIIEVTALKFDLDFLLVFPRWVTGFTIIGSYVPIFSNITGTFKSLRLRPSCGGEVCVFLWI